MEETKLPARRTSLPGRAGSGPPPLDPVRLSWWRAVIADCACLAGWRAFQAALDHGARNDLAAALPYMRDAVRREPALAAPVALLEGRLLMRRNEIAAAIGCFRAGLAHTPSAPLLHVSLGHALMLLGEYEPGWAALEWRTRLDFGPAVWFPRLPGPEWRGETMPDGTLLVRAEQGMGDCLMLARYLPAIARRVGRLVLACHRPLMPLLATIPGVAAVVDMAGEMPAHDGWIFLGSVPPLFGTTLATIPFPAGFLQPDPARLAAWRARLPRTRAGGLAVGLVWGGNPDKEDDADRSIPFATMRALLAVPGIRFVSLQVGRQARPPGLLDVAPHLADFAETAAAVARLDLVISVDTAVAHLAGALGVACWLLLPFAPDWRWLLRREDSPWYASLRLFRQEREGEWEPVIARLAASLAARRDAPPRRR